MNKLIRVATVAGLFGSLCLTTACGSSGADEPDTTIEIFAIRNSPAADAPGKDWFWPKLVKKELGLDVTVKFASQQSEYLPQLQARAAADDLPDLFYSDPKTQLQLGGQGLAADWNKLTDELPTWTERHGTAEFADATTRDGEQLGLTGKKALPYKLVVVVRQDWLDELGLQPPRTLEEYRQVAEAFTEQDPDGNGKDDTYGWSSSVTPEGLFFGFDPFLGAFDALGTWTESGGTVKPVATGANYRDAMTWLNEFTGSGVMDPNWKAQKREDQAVRWQAGKVGMMQMDWVQALGPKDYATFAKSNPEGVVSVIDPPEGPSGASAASTDTSAGLTLGMSNKAVEEGKSGNVAKLLEWMAGDGYLPTVFGEEGPDKGYTVQNGRPVPNGLKEYTPNIQLQNMALTGEPTEIASRYGRFVTEQPDGSSFSGKDFLATLDEYPKTDVTRYTALPQQPTENPADLLRTLAESTFGFVTGTKPLSEWDSYTEAVEQQGMTAWTAAAAKAYKESR